MLKSVMHYLVWHFFYALYVRCRFKKVRYLSRVVQSAFFFNKFAPTHTKINKTKIQMFIDYKSPFVIVQEICHEGMLCLSSQEFGGSSIDDIDRREDFEW